MSQTERAANPALLWLHRRGLEVAGWVLVTLGVAALVLPGPGLLLLAGGLAVLSTRYAWAKRRLAPVRRQARHFAALSVRTWGSIGLSSLGALTLIALGVVWVISPPAPRWWPLDSQWWLFGGWGTGATLVASGLIGLTLLGYSLVKHRPSRTGWNVHSRGRLAHQDDG